MNETPKLRRGGSGSQCFFGWHPTSCLVGCMCLRVLHLKLQEEKGEPQKTGGGLLEQRV